MQFPYAKIFKQAYQLARSHKFLWLFGLFLVWGSAINLSLLLTDPNSGDYQQETATVLSWLQSNSLAANLTLSVFGLFLLVILFLYFSSKVGIIVCVKAILDKQMTSFRKGLAASRLFYLRVAAVILSLGLVLFALSLVLFLPVYNLSVNGFESRAMMLGVLAMIILIPVALMTTFINALAPVFIISNDLKIRDSIKASFALINQHWMTLLAFAVLQNFLIIVAFFIAVFVVSLFLLPFVFFGPLIYMEFGFQSSVIFMSVGFGLAIVLFLLLQMGIIAFREISWVLAFDQLVKPVKTSESTEPAPVPEVAS
jgi:hypothetical protein